MVVTTGKAREALETSKALKALKALENAGSKKVREGYARYGIVAPKSFGVPMGKIQALGKRLGTDHALAVELWRSGWYEARLLAAYVDDPAQVTAAQMDRWVKQMDNWGVVDTLIFACWDRSPHAWGRIRPWCGRKEEFVKRAGFVMLACIALHDKTISEAKLAPTLKLIERGAADERNFVKKGVSWALRTVGRQGPRVHRESVALATRLTKSESKSARWVGRDALRDLTRPLVLNAMARSAK